MPQQPSFSEFKLNKQLLNAIADMGYDKPTPIQQKAIPLIGNGQDLMGIAQTGTGKTAAFVLPILMKVKYAQGMHVRALILAPTKELVLQIEENCRELASYCDLRFLALYGGIGPKTQIEKLNSGVDIIVSTPGRFMDLYLRGDIITKQIKTLVLDEADKMMDMGFMPQIRKILEVIPTKRQNLLFSATMAEKVKSLSEEFLEYPQVVEVTPQASTVDTIKQERYNVPNFKSKINFIGHLLKDDSLERVIIFVKKKETADNIGKFINRKDGSSVKIIHSNKGQNARIHAMDEFKKGDVRVLVTTDVSSRGIDVSMVTHVINFDVPAVYEDYVHRIGRTGRAENEGTAITFVNELESFHIEKIENLIGQKIPVKPTPSGVKIEETPFVEKQEMDRAIDYLKKKEDPDFKGAFHEKKKLFLNTKGYNKNSKGKNKKKRR